MARKSIYAHGNNDHQDYPNSDTLWKLLLISAVACLIWNDIRISDAIASNLNRHRVETASEVKLQEAALVSFGAQELPDYGVTLPKTAKSPLAFAIDPGFAQRYAIAPHEVAEARKALNTYVQQYASVAVAEMQKFGIPASITLAQGLLESGVGQSRLAIISRNHFGIKCFSRTCKRGHCVNFADDTHKDFFVKYRSVWESYRAHSQLLKGTARYQPLFRLAPTDFAGWAHGLSKYGYATDPKYAQKIIAIIRSLKLDRYDQLGAF